MDADYSRERNDDWSYERDGWRPFRELTFSAPVELDVGALVERWRPWLDLTDTPTAPLRARHAVHLARLATDPCEPPYPTWFSIVSDPGARPQMVLQARAPAYECASMPELPVALRSTLWTEAVKRLAAWPQLGVPRRTALVGMLTQLGFVRDVFALLPEVRLAPGDAEQAQLVYELTRAAHQVNRQSRQPIEVFEHLATSGETPMLKLASALHIVSAELRYHNARDAAKGWLARADELRAGLSAEPPWLAHLGHSRFHRAAALYYVAAREATHVSRHLRRALDHSDALPALSADDVVRHHQREERRLVLEACLKLDTMASTAAAPPETLEELAAIDPDEPEVWFTIGSYHVGRRELDAAQRAFRRAACAGTVRGAWAACNAGRCLEAIGRPAEAAAAYRLSLELDPAARTPRDRLRELGGPRVSPADPDRRIAGRRRAGGGR